MVEDPSCYGRDVGLIPGRGTKISQDTEQLSQSTTAREFRDCIQRFCMTQRRPQMLQLGSDRAKSTNTFFKKKLKLLKKRSCFRQRKNYSAPVTSRQVEEAWTKASHGWIKTRSRSVSSADCRRMFVPYPTRQIWYSQEGMGGGKPGFSIRVSPPPCLAQVTRGPNIWQKDHPEGSPTESGTWPVAAPRCGFTHQSSTSSWR